MPQTINENENQMVIRLGTVSGKTICTGGSNQMLGCTKLTLAQTVAHYDVAHMNNHVRELASTNPYIRQCCL
jgi:hypothetical protein